MKAGKRDGWRWVLLAAGVVLAACASFAVTDDAPDADKEAKLLEGTWKFVSLTTDGKEAPKEFVDKARWTFRGKEIIIPGPQAAKIAYKLDPGRSPKTIDLTGTEGPGKGKTLKGIYKLRKERLTICFSKGETQEKQDAPRPEKFDGANGQSLLVLELTDEE